MLKTSLDLVTRIQDALAANLGVLKGKYQNISEFYRFEYCRFVNNTTETFLFLVKNERAEASRVLVRPALEVTFRLQAIQTKPELLLRVAATLVITLAVGAAGGFILGHQLGKARSAQAVTEAETRATEADQRLRGFEEALAKSKEAEQASNLLRHLIQIWLFFNY